MNELSEGIIKYSLKDIKGKTIKEKERVSMSKYDYDDYDDDLADKIEESKKKKKKKKRMSSTTKWAIALIIELILIVCLGYGIMRAYLHQKYQKFDHVKDMTVEELEINEGACWKFQPALC